MIRLNGFNIWRTDINKKPMSNDKMCNSLPQIERIVLDLWLKWSIGHPTGAFIVRIFNLLRWWGNWLGHIELISFYLKKWCIYKSFIITISLVELGIIRYTARNTLVAIQGLLLFVFQFPICIWRAPKLLSCRGISHNGRGYSLIKSGVRSPDIISSFVARVTSSCLPELQIHPRIPCMEGLFFWNRS